MMNRDTGRILICSLFALLLLLLTTVRAEGPHSVVVEYFREPGCPDCVKIERTVLKRLAEEYGGFYELKQYDIRKEPELLRLIAYQRHFGIDRNDPVSIFVDYRGVLSGYDEISASLVSEVGSAISLRSVPGWLPSEPIDVPADASPAIERLESMTIGIVLLNGLLDGLNPCALGTLVFLVSMLAVSGISGISVLSVGAGFCAGSFCMYLAIGIGLLGSLYLLSGFWALRLCVEWGMAVVLVILALVSFGDARAYALSGNASDVQLRLPIGIRGRINAIVKANIGRGVATLFVGGLVIGVCATCLEAVCTGQIYVPTLALVIKGSGDLDSGWKNLLGRAWGFMLAYNAAAILPALAVVLCTYMGLRASWFLRFSKKHVVPMKVMLGLLFILMAGLIIILA